LKQRAEYLLFGVAVFDQVLVAAVLAWTWRLDLYPDTRALFVALLLVPFWAHLHRYFGLYDSHRLEGWRSAAARVFTASTVGFLLTAAVLLSVGLRNQIPDLAVFTLRWIALLLLSRGVLYTVLHTLRRRGVDRRSVCVIGSWESAAEMAERFRKRPEWGLAINTVGVGAVGQRTFYRFPENNVIGADLEDVIREEGLDELLIISRPEDVPVERGAIDFCKKYGVQCRIRLLGEELESAPIEYIPGQVAWIVHSAEMNIVRLWVKRAIDLILSGVAILLLSPLYAVVAILVKLSSPGPVFFYQTRVGLRGRKFVVIKFRTMVDGAESMMHLVAHRNITGGPIFKDAKDLRVTDIGRILRRFSLDELPQLFNVFKGDMSLVGPRPLPVSESSAIEGTYRRRFNMRPGITCRWQVEGRNTIGFARWMELDLEYVDHWSLREDVRLLLLTIPAVLTGRGAY
jgi:exopolysaccharide biosynthesis polyprenyl glycosylphosphotransferase